MLEIVKKTAFITFALLLFFLFQSALSVIAAPQPPSGTMQLDESPCSFNPDVAAGNRCDDGLDCHVPTEQEAAETGRIHPYCVPEQGSLNCTCKKENDANNRGFVCGTEDLGAQCQEGWACHETPGEYNIDAEDGDSKYVGYELKGVMCRRPQTEANCFCRPDSSNNRPGTDNQTFQCELASDKSITGVAECNGSEICTDEPGNTNYTAKHMRGTLFNDYGGTFDGGLRLKNIKCAPPVAECTCDNPGQARSGQNGFECTLNGKTESGFCAHENQACKDDPDNIIDSREGSIIKDPLFGSARLKNITCSTEQNAGEPPPVPTPPPPPCAQGFDTKTGACPAFLTAFGEIATNPTDFIRSIFALLLAIAGGIALLLIIKAGYQFMVSAGNPEMVKAAREQLIAAIVGLLFIIFSFVILEVVGVDILRLPCFSSACQTTVQPGPGSSCTMSGTGGWTCPSGYSCIPAKPGESSGTCQKSAVNQQTCLQAGGFCATSGLCRSENGSIIGAPGCGRGQVCCSL